MHSYLVTDATGTIKKLVSVPDKMLVTERCAKPFGISECDVALEMFAADFEEYVDVDDVAVLPDMAKLRVKKRTEHSASDHDSVVHLSRASTVTLAHLSAGYAYS